MKHWISPLQSLARPPVLSTTNPARRRSHLAGARHLQIRTFTLSRQRGIERASQDNYDNSNARPAQDLNHNITQEEKDDWERRLEENKHKQIRTPWHREGSETPPVARQRDAGAMTKGKLLTTPSRMLKLVLPLTTKDTNTDRKDAEPLALLVHPQQPLSYLERLIQAELPVLKTKDGHERIPNVYFRAEDSMQDDIEASTPSSAQKEDKKAAANKPSEASAQEKEAQEMEIDEQQEEKEEEEEEEEEEEAEKDQLEKADSLNIDGKTEKTGKLSGGNTTPTPTPHTKNPHNRKTPSEAAHLRRGAGKGGVESYSGLGHEAASPPSKDRPFVRWSSSTEIGDFIRDAARGQEFAVEIEGAPNDIRVGVPSFNDRTYYLRMRLRKASKKIADMAEIKKECDELAHKGAQRVALGGFGVLCGWWYLVYRLTFETELGWDVMEPVTYLVGLSTLIAGYVWFLYHNREVSYKSAMNFTISRRQSKLYAARGFDLRKWETLVEDGNALRKEIKAVANEYDVEWDELEDEKEESVARALREEREKEKGGKKGDGDGEEEGKGKKDK